MGKKLETALAILNGLVGDHLVREGNGLATEMQCMREGSELALTHDVLARLQPSPRIVILLHGLMNTEDIWTHAGGGDYGTMLERDHGFTPFYVRYNTGLTVADNGRAFAALLDRLTAAYPVAIEEILPIGYSMGGLVVRSACHVAAAAHSAWLPLIHRAIYVGTPHLGAPMERVGRVVAKLLRAIPDPVTRLVGQIADLRSDGVKNLGDGLHDPRHPVPLLPSMQHYLIAGSLSNDPRLAALFGDAVVSIGSATHGGSADAATFALPPSHVRIVHGKSHVDLAHDPQVYEHLRQWSAP